MIGSAPPFLLSDGDVERLGCRGFLVIENFLDADIVRHLAREIEALEFDSTSSRLKRGAVFARRNLVELEFIRSLLAQPCVKCVVDALAAGAIAVRGILFDKTGLANWTVPWHQDRSIAVRERLDVEGFGPWSTKSGVVHVQPPLEILKEMITLRIHVDSCGVENGPLRIIPQSHDRILSQAEIEDLAGRAEQICCTVGAGGLVIMRPLILHASSPAAKASHRRVIHIEFGPKTLPAGLNWAISFG